MGRQGSKQEREPCGRANTQERERGMGATRVSLSRVSVLYRHCLVERERGLWEAAGCARRTERLYLGGLGLELVRLVH